MIQTGNIFRIACNNWNYCWLVIFSTLELSRTASMLMTESPQKVCHQHQCQHKFNSVTNLSCVVSSGIFVSVRWLFYTLFTLPISVLTAIITVDCVEPQLLLIGPGHSKSPEQKLVLWFLRETRTKGGSKSFKIFCLKAMSWRENMTLNALKLEQEVIFCYIFET